MVSDIKNKIIFGKSESKAIKGFAILLMLYYHVVVRQGRSLIPVWREFWYESGNLCVALFAFISVYGISKKVLANKISIGATFRTWLSQIVGLYGSFWPAVVVAFVGTFIYNQTIDHTNRFVGVFGKGVSGVLHLVLNVLGLNHLIYGDWKYAFNQVWWYMSLSIVIVILTPIVCAFSRKIRYCLIPIWFVVMLLVYYFNSDTFKSHFGPYIEVIILVIIGVNVAERKVFAVKQKSDLVIHSVVIALWIIYNYIPFKANVDFRLCTHFVVAYSAIVLLTVLFDKLKRLKSVMSYFGGHSANIFYLHTFVAGYWVALKNQIIRTKYGILVFAITLLITLGLSYIVKGLTKITKWNDFIAYLRRKI